MELKTPQSLKVEHDELHAQLARAREAGGAVGDAAKAVAEILHPHFIKEEEFALPPLGILPSVAAGKISPEMKAAAAMAERLKAEVGQMLQEHREIVGALDGLKQAAKSEGKDEFAHFADKLVLHAQTEEEVLYPASILVGEYLKLKL